MKFYLLCFYSIISILTFISFSCNNNDDNREEINLTNSKIQNFKGFYFISNTSNEYNLMFYDFLEDSVVKIFGSKTQKVIEVEHSTQNNVVLFLTVSRLNKKTAIPEYEGIKLYRYDPASRKTELLNKFSPSIQIYSFWLDINRYKIVRVFFDEIVASYVNKHSLIYNPFGKLLSEENEVFDLVKSGYPIREMQPLNLYSQIKKYQVKIVADSIFVLNNDKKKSQKILSDASVLDLIWAENEKHLIVFYQNSKSSRYKILLFDLINNRIVKTFDEEGIKNFDLIGNYLIYDFLENNYQRIEVVNIEKLLTVKKISVGRNNFLKNVSLR